MDVVLLSISLQTVLGVEEVLILPVISLERMMYYRLKMARGRAGLWKMGVGKKRQSSMRKEGRLLSRNWVGPIDYRLMKGVLLVL